jgi:hypothetical protein
LTIDRAGLPYQSLEYPYQSQAIFSRQQWFDGEISDRWNGDDPIDMQTIPGAFSG